MTILSRSQTGRVLGLDAHAFGDRQAEDAHAGDLQAGERQALDELGGRQVDVDVIAEPVEGDFHECWR